MSPDLYRALAELDPGQRLLVALDFDGTLSHLVAVPSQARPAPGVLALLEELEDAPLTDVVLVSGRALDDLAMVSGAAGVATLIGSHGQEHGAALVLSDEESALLESLDAEVRRRVGGVEGVHIEDKPAGFAVHVRHCAPAEADTVVEQVRTVAGDTPDVSVLEGKMVVEVSVRPLDKGAALRRLIRADPQRRVIFAGDDVTDESAMAALSPQDISIKVGAGDTVARFRVAGPDEMVDVLAAVAAARRATAQEPPG